MAAFQRTVSVHLLAVLIVEATTHAGCCVRGFQKWLEKAERKLEPDDKSAPMNAPAATVPQNWSVGSVAGRERLPLLHLLARKSDWGSDTIPCPRTHSSCFSPQAPQAEGGGGKPLVVAVQEIGAWRERGALGTLCGQGVGTPISTKVW